MLITELFLLAIVLLVSVYWWKNRRFLYLMRKIPSVSAFDLTIWNIFNFYRSDTRALFKVVERISSQTRGISAIKYSPVPLINITAPEDIKLVLNSKECVGKPYFVTKFPKLSQGTLFGHIDSWQPHRKLLNPYFGLHSLRTLIPIFNSKVQTLLENLAKEEGKGEFNVFHNMTALTLETILKVMEYDVDIQNQEKKQRDVFIRKLEHYATAVTIRIFKFWLHSDVIYNLSHIYHMERTAGKACSFVFAPKVIESIREKMTRSESKDEKPKTFIRAFIDARNKFTESEILDEINTLIVAAQDTSALATSNTLVLLGMHKDIQSKVLDELKQVLGSSTEYLDIEQLSELSYLEMVINESMRLMPVVPLVGRTNDREITLTDGLIMPAKSNLIMPIFSIHKNKALWGEDADEFKPERFDRENITKVHPYAFIPFARGPRMCIGWRYAMILMKIQLARILLRYEVDTRLKLDELEFKFSVTLNICQGHKITIKRQLR